MISIEKRQIHEGVCILVSYGPRWGVSPLINHSPGKHLNQKVCRQKNIWVVSDNKNWLFMRKRFIIRWRRCLHEKQIMQWNWL